MVQILITGSADFPVFYPCWVMQILMPATGSLSYSVSVSAELFVCLSALHFVGQYAWHSLSWTAFVPEGCSVSCYALWPLLRVQLGTWAGPKEAACDWSSGAGSELAGSVQTNLAAEVNLVGKQSGNNQ